MRWSNRGVKFTPPEEALSPARVCHWPKYPLRVKAAVGVGLPMQLLDSLKPARSVLNRAGRGRQKIDALRDFGPPYVADGVKIGHCGDVRGTTAFPPRTDIRQHAYNRRLVLNISIKISSGAPTSLPYRRMTETAACSSMHCLALRGACRIAVAGCVSIGNVCRRRFFQRTRRGNKA